MIAGLASLLLASGAVVPALSVGIGQVEALVADARGNLYIAAPDLGRVLKLDSFGLMTVVAGGGHSFSAGPALQARLSAPAALALDVQGNLYLADRRDGSLRRIDAQTHYISTLLGTPAAALPGAAQLPPPAARELLDPSDMVIDSSGRLYISDAAANRVRRFDISSGRLETFAGMGASGFTGDGGLAARARLAAPAGLAIDSAGNLYVADRGNHRVRKVDARTGTITTIAGNGLPGLSGDGGAASKAQLQDPTDLAIDQRGDLLIADLGNKRVRRVEARSGVIQTLEGLSPSLPGALALAPDGAAFVADLARLTILRRDVRGKLSVVAGNGGLGYTGEGVPATQGHLANPSGLASDFDGNLYIADAGSHRVRRIDARTGLIRTVAGNGRPAFAGDGGPALQASLHRPSDLGFDAAGNLLIADTENHRIRRVARDGSITTVAGTGRDRIGPIDLPALETDIARPSHLALARDGALIVAQAGAGLIRRFDPRTGRSQLVAGRHPDGPAGDPELATFRRLEGISAFALAGDGSVLFAESSANRIWRLDLGSGRMTPEAGRGIELQMRDLSDARNMGFSRIGALASAGADIYFGEFTRGLLRVDGSTHGLSTIVPGYVSGLLVVPPDQVYFSDPTGFVRRWGPQGVLTTVAGGGFGF